jgi:hypothetical protein
VFEAVDAVVVREFKSAVVGEVVGDVVGQVGEVVGEIVLA